MTARTELSASRRRTRTEVQQLVAEFVSSGMRRSEFCRSRQLSFGTLDRHLKKLEPISQIVDASLSHVNKVRCPHPYALASA